MHLSGVRPASAIAAALLALAAVGARAADEVPADEATVAVAPAPPKTLLGKASYYANWLHGRLTASGERFDRKALTAAHRSLPFGTLVKVENLLTGRSVVVRINDRGPALRDRIIDLSEAAASAIGLRGRGVAPVRISLQNARSEPNP
jgi:rare lipoprotein A